MKKLFGTKGQKSTAAGPLCGKTVVVGACQVLCEVLLGSGGYADIYMVTDISNGAKYALKHLRLNGDKDIIAEVQREAKTQAKLKNHPNILRLHAVAFAGPKGGETDGFFLLDYCPGTLLDLLQRHNFQIDERTVLHIFHCVCQAIAHMHRQKPPMAHRDLKAENVLMLPDGTWVLCDYGSATTRAQAYDTVEAMAAEEDVIRKHTTPAYRPPEMWDLYQRQPIDTKVDIWALGVLLFVLCFGRLPFAGDSKLQILNCKYDMPPTRPPQLRALIRSLLTVNPAERPDITQTLEQLNEAAVAITGQPLKQPVISGTASNQQSSSSSSQTAPQQAAQQQQQARLQQQPPATTAAGSSGSFWSTADALGSQQRQQAAVCAPSGSLHQQQQQQQHGLHEDWARFSSPGASPQQPAAAVQKQPVQQEHATLPGSTMQAAQRAQPAAADDVRSSRSNGSLAQRSSQSQQSASSAAAATSVMNGHAHPSVPTVGRSTSSSGAGLQQGPPDMQKRLADITARAQAAAAARANTAAATQQQQQQQQQQQPPDVKDTDRDPPLLLERQSRPYCLAGGSVSSSAPSTPMAAAAAHAGEPFLQRASASQGGVSHAAAAAPVAAHGGDSMLSSSSKAPLGAGTTAAAAGQAAIAAAGPVASTATVQTSRSAPAPATAGIAAAAVGGNAGVHASALAELRATVFGEMDLLRAQVRSLSDQNQAFVLRIKQLEDYAERQEAAVATLQEQLASLQRRQQLGTGETANVSSRNAAVTRSCDGVPGQGVGGSFWSTQSTVL